MKTLLCKIGIHRPLKIGSINFVDIINNKAVRNAKCSCGKEWLTDSISGWWGFRILLNKIIEEE